MAGNAEVVRDMRAIGKLCQERYGLKVIEVSGWTTRGRSSAFAPRCAEPLSMTQKTRRAER